MRTHATIPFTEPLSMGIAMSLEQSASKGCGLLCQLPGCWSAEARRTGSMEAIYAGDDPR